MHKILVTGGAGFIGSCFIRQILDRPEFIVRNYDALTYAGNLDSLREKADHPGYSFCQADITDRKAVSRALREFQPNSVVHFAAESHVDRSIDGPDVFVKTNVLGTQILLDVSRNYWSELPKLEQSTFRFLHVSTDEVYGSLGFADPPFTESHRYAPNSPYSASKAAADHFARAYFHTYGLPVIITNCSNNYGPYQFPEKLIPLMILNALEGKPLPVYGDGFNVRDWLYVGDHCEALGTILERGIPGEVYNIGGNSEQRNIDVVKTVCLLVDKLRPGLKHAPCESLITYVKDRPGHDRRYAIDSSKIRTELRWQPRHNFCDGLRETVQWYLDNPIWVERVTSGVYRRERLGLVQPG